MQGGVELQTVRCPYDRYNRLDRRAKQARWVTET